MEMQMEATTEAISPTLTTTMTDRLQAVTQTLERLAERLAAVELQASATRESGLAQRLTEAETTIATLRTQASERSGRKTTTLIAKEGTALEAGHLDAALATLSLEQRIAVKAQLLRSGLLG